jgi:hypothetical protein
MDVRKLAVNTYQNASLARDAGRSGNMKVLTELLGPAVRGLLLQKGKEGSTSEMRVGNRAFFDWQYTSNKPELTKLYEAAKRAQWDAATAVDWSIDVDLYSEERDLIPDSVLPLQAIPAYRGLPAKTQKEHRHALLSWMLSQFLHGEQGALFAACQVTEAVEWTSGKLFGASQVFDEGRHVEVFHRYLTEKLGKLYQINDNLYVIIDALMTDSRWDLKFLGMQIMIEGLALGAFGTIRASTKEPLLKDVLRYVITDEARHVHYGVVALQDYYLTELSERERMEREDWAFEMSLLLRNRFLAHEFYDEYYGHLVRRAEWDRLILESQFMEFFRKTMFRRIVPNLKRIGLLSDRIRAHYGEIGLLEWENERAAPDLTAADLLSG